MGIRDTGHSRQHNIGVGPGIVDPTKNVLDLVDAAVQRIDNLSELQAQLLDEKIRRMEREWIHLDEIGKLREQHNREMRDSESRRVDANRSTDLAAVGTNAAQSLAAVNVLAETARSTAETLRTQAANMASAAATATDRLVTPLAERLAALEKIINIGQGRSAGPDPQMAEMSQMMQKLLLQNTRGTGRGEGLNLAWVLLLGAVGLLGTLVVIVSTVIGAVLWISSHNQGAPAYTPAPSGYLVPTTPPQPPPH